MPKPYIICHMMTSLDGRIDCAMTAQLKGVDEYYKTLEELNVSTTLSGRVTAQLEMALPGAFVSKSKEVYAREGFSKKKDATGYEIIVDTRGTLLWNDDSQYDKPHLIIVGEQVNKEYLDYLDSKNISWIVCGQEKIDLRRAVEILSEHFGVKRMAVVGGSAINTSFLAAGLLDEISILIGAGIDGRQGMPGVFDGFPAGKSVTPLKLEKIKAFDDGAVWIRYKTQQNV